MPKESYREREMPEKTYREREIEIMVGKREDAFTFLYQPEIRIGNREDCLFLLYRDWEVGYSRIPLHLESGNGKLSVKGAKFSFV